MSAVLTYLLIVIEAICSFLLIGVILLQRSKSQGVGMAFGGQMGEALFGSQVGNVLTRATVILAIVFLANTTLLALVGSNRPERSIAEDIDSGPAPMSTPVPSAMPVDTPAPFAPGADVHFPAIPAADMPSLPEGDVGSGDPMAVPAEPVGVVEAPAVPAVPDNEPDTPVAE